MLKLLIELEADVNPDLDLHFWPGRPLFTAVAYQNPVAAEALLAAGANPRRRGGRRVLLDLALDRGIVGKMEFLGRFGWGVEKLHRED
ncbi:hypothetical protein K432DRAFT_387699 [Lepidopterella palustris CBS 459.81]|uniref:Ankyrin n=1 Tax=Lepidopterella palustris CBS 459.81 TaxID=1314670 RepID=A0A8E2DVY6_9PEZI|nr:hypothetical protein K432DRAFT_387699 [Lepidopterella palustris CBS 459.81]